MCILAFLHPPPTMVSSPHSNIMDLHISKFNIHFLCSFYSMSQTFKRSSLSLPETISSHFCGFFPVSPGYSFWVFFPAPSSSFHLLKFSALHLSSVSILSPGNFIKPHDLRSCRQLSMCRPHFFLKLHSQVYNCLLGASASVSNGHPPARLLSPVSH